jgi:hypothetical protein
MLKKTRANIRLSEQKEHSKALDVMYRNTFTTPDGKKVLADLKMKYLPDKLSTEDAHTTAVKVGESNPIREIIRRIENGLA